MANSLCEEHEQEVMNLFCGTCDQPICRDCTIFDHRNHDYTFIKDVFPAEKEKIMKSVREAEAKLPVFESAIESIEEQEKSVQRNLTSVQRDIDEFIDQHTALLERKREVLKEELNRLSAPQITRLREQKKSLSESRGRVQKCVESANETVARENEAKVLLMKNWIIQEMTELSLQSPSMPRQTMFYKLNESSPFNDEAIGNMAEICESGKFVLGMLGGEPGVMYATRAKQTTNFVIFPRNNGEATAGKRDEVHVIIKTPSEKISPAIIYNEDGSYSFSFMPVNVGEHCIKVLINGVRSCGSPLSWKVNRAFYLQHALGLKNVLRSRRSFEIKRILPSEALFQNGQHSWKAKVRMVENSIGEKHKIGVTHSNGRRTALWEDGSRCLKALNGDFFERNPSSIQPFRHEDVFVFYLNVEKKRLIIYHEQTKESDTFHPLTAPVSPLIQPEKAFNFDVVNV